MMQSSVFLASEEAKLANINIVMSSVPLYFVIASLMANKAGTSFPRNVLSSVCNILAKTW